MTRLPGWYYGGSDPDGYLSAAGFVAHLERYAASFDAPVVGGTTVRELGEAAPGDTGWSPTAAPGVPATWSSRPVPHGVPRVPAGLDGGRGAHRQPLPQPGPARPGRRARGRRLGLRRADRRRAQPRGSRRGPRGGSAHQDAPPLPRHGHLLVAGEHRPSRAHHRRRPRRRGRPARAVAAAGRPPRPGRPRAGPRPGRAAGPRGQAGRAPRRDDGIPGPVPSGPGRPRGRRRREDAPLPRRRRRLRRQRRPHRPRSWSRSGHGGSSYRRPSGPWTWPARASARCWSPTGYRPDYPWLRLPITGPDGFIRQHRGVTAAPGVYVVGQRFQHRRDSGFIDGARHDARTVVQHLRTGSTSVVARDLSEEPAA